eukprot:ANDGO_07685.mRNA.1 hypothetical protein
MPNPLALIAGICILLLLAGSAVGIIESAAPADVYYLPFGSGGIKGCTWNNPFVLGKINNCSEVIVQSLSTCWPSNLAYDPKLERFYWNSYSFPNIIYASDRSGNPVSGDNPMGTNGCGYEYIQLPSKTQIAQMKLLSDGSILFFDTPTQSLSTVDPASHAITLFYPSLPFQFDAWDVNSQSVFFGNINDSIPFQRGLCIRSMSIATRSIREYGCYYDGFAVNTMMTSSEDSFFLIGSPHIIVVSIASGEVTNRLAVTGGSLKICGGTAIWNLFSMQFSTQDSHMYVSGDVFVNNVQGTCFLRLSTNGTADPLFWTAVPSSFMQNIVVVNPVPPSLPPPAVNSISPSSGSRNSGQQTVVVSGSNFRPGASSLWGGAIASPCIFSSSSIIFCTVPKSPVAGQALVQVSNMEGVFSTDKVFFTYTDSQE